MIFINCSPCFFSIFISFFLSSCLSPSLSLSLLPLLPSFCLHPKFFLSCFFFSFLVLSRFFFSFFFFGLFSPSSSSLISSPRKGKERIGKSSWHFTIPIDQRVFNPDRGDLCPPQVGDICLFICPHRDLIAADGKIALSCSWDGLDIEIPNSNCYFLSLHCGTKPGRFETFKHSLWHKLGSKRMGEQRKRMSEQAYVQMSDRVLTYIDSRLFWTTVHWADSQRKHPFCFPGWCVIAHRFNGWIRANGEILG